MDLKKIFLTLYCALTLCLIAVLIIYTQSARVNAARLEVQHILTETQVSLRTLQKDSVLVKTDLPQMDHYPNWLEEKSLFLDRMNFLLENPYLIKLLKREGKESVLQGFEDIQNLVAREISTIDYLLEGYGDTVPEAEAEQNRIDFHRVYEAELKEEIDQLYHHLDMAVGEHLSLFEDLLMNRQERGFNRISVLSISLFLGAFLIIYFLSGFFVLRYQREEKRFLEHDALTMDVTIDALAFQVELRDNNTGSHTERTAKYVEIITREMAGYADFKEYLTEKYIRDITRSAILHDIGKIGIPDRILLKPGKLTDEEFGIIKNHCLYGAETLRKAQERLSFNSYLTVAVQLIESHHENWDGTGYPYGLKGSFIPLSGRIMAVADVYDAMRSKRVYKDAINHNGCVQYIKEQAGLKFDPRVVRAFLARSEDIRQVARSLEES
ncbi:MAG: HD domain-containing protein [Spirochaetales bacterium]|nr:HD domain-containing protein [Spirochaetales bacterium]